MLLLLGVVVLGVVAVAVVLMLNHNGDRADSEHQIKAPLAQGKQSRGARLVGDADPIESRPTSRPTRDPRFPPEFYRSYPPSSRIPMKIPFVGEGIEVTPGQFLPPLNGVRIEDRIPKIKRSRRLPHPGPVVAKVIGPDGQEFWEHQDGSYTSCTYSQIRKPDGSTQRIVATQHGAIPNTGARGKAK